MDAIREVCRRLMAGPPPALDLLEVSRRLGEHRRRPIILIGFVADAGTPSGMWVNAQSQDFIFYDNVTSPVHQDAIIWHELSHLLLEHAGPLLDPEQARRLLPDLDPALIMRMLGRDSYDQSVEREAEQLASLLMLDHTDRVRRSARTTSPALDRLKGALDFRDGNG